MGSLDEDTTELACTITVCCLLLDVLLVLTTMMLPQYNLLISWIGYMFTFTWIITDVILICVAYEREGRW